VEREVMLTGIGGQGVQLAAQVLARAATLEGRNAMFFGVYGGTMRGGNTDSTIVVSDGEIAAPPIISRTWSAIVMHPQFWEPLRGKLRPGAVVLLNSTLFEGELERESYRVFDLPASQRAAELGNPLTASMWMTGAYAGITGLVGLEAAIEAMQASLPPYRRQHIEANATALRAGFEAIEGQSAPAWTEG